MNGVLALWATSLDQPNSPRRVNRSQRANLLILMNIAGCENVIVTVYSNPIIISSEKGARDELDSIIDLSLQL
jgi:hypothetical protein